MIDLNGITLVVTGFPRSGTSMMMKMLRYSGIGVIADDASTQPQNKFSPYGCEELKTVAETIKELGEEQTANKVVKIVAPYSEVIPLDRPLKAIFMLRDVNEIITSLLAMRRIWAESIPGTIKFTRDLLAENNVPVLFVQYKDAVNYPRSTALRIEEFLEAELDIDNMAKAVDRNARTQHERDPKLKEHSRPDEIVRIDIDSYKDVEPLVYHLGDI